MYLAIGFSHGFTWSVEVDTDDYQKVFDTLALASEGTLPDEILLVRNGDTSPDVVKHW